MVIIHYVAEVSDELVRGRPRLGWVDGVKVALRVAERRRWR